VCYGSFFFFLFLQTRLQAQAAGYSYTQGRPNAPCNNCGSPWPDPITRRHLGPTSSSGCAEPSTWATLTSQKLPPVVSFQIQFPPPAPFPDRATVPVATVPCMLPVLCVPLGTYPPQQQQQLSELRAPPALSPVTSLSLQSRYCGNCPPAALPCCSALLLCPAALPCCSALLLCPAALPCC